jgi:hypothetical protein
MPAVGAMRVLVIMAATRVTLRTGRRVGTAFRQPVLINVSLMDIVKMAFVQIIRVALVRYRRMPTSGTVLMRMLLMLIAVCHFPLSV